MIPPALIPIRKMRIAGNKTRFSINLKVTEVEIIKNLSVISPIEHVLSQKYPYRTILL
jgi:hypothetical protein